MWHVTSNGPVELPCEVLLLIADKPWCAYSKRTWDPAILLMFLLPETLHLHYIRVSIKGRSCSSHQCHPFQLSTRVYAVGCYANCPPALSARVCRRSLSISTV